MYFEEIENVRNKKIRQDLWGEDIYIYFDLKYSKWRYNDYKLFLDYSSLSILDNWEVYEPEKKKRTITLYRYLYVVDKTKNKKLYKLTLWTTDSWHNCSSPFQLLVKTETREIEIEE